MTDLLTNSRMSSAKSCLKKHWLEYELGLRPAREKQPLRMGTAVHEGLDLLAQGKTPGEAADAVQALYAELPKWAVEPDQVEDWLVEGETCATLVYAYAWYWKESLVAEIVATEQAFELPLVNPETGAASRNWAMAGKIDKIARLHDGRLAIIEHKTTGESIDPESDYWKRLRLDQQISLYIIAARKLGHDVATVLYDVIRKPCIRPKKVEKADKAKWPIYYDKDCSHMGDCPERENSEMYGARFLADISDRPEFYFARKEIPRTESDIVEFTQELWQQQKLLSECRRTGCWFRNTNACIHPYKCDYFQLCCDAIDPTQGVPAGFVKLDNVHPELGK
jgi:hypothetical protein